MEQERCGDHNQRLKEIIQQGGARKQVQPPPLPPQPCPRCASTNTKFCYYNNYSLAQPRYFCKTCKRYWTRGGTLRNVPIGCGSRKGKRAKASSSSSGSQQPPQPPQQPQLPLREVVFQTTVMTAQDPAFVVAPTNNPFYQRGGGYLTSLAGIHSQAHPFDQSLNDGSSSSNLGFASGFNVGASLAPQGQIQPPHQFSDEMGRNISASTHIEWPQNMSYEASLWSNISTTSTSGSINTQRNESASGSGSSPFNPNQWPDFPGYGPP